MEIILYYVQFLLDKCSLDNKDNYYCLVKLQNQEGTMSDRREFIKGSLVTVAALAVSSPHIASASATGMPNGIIYTAENPGKWAKKVGSHQPQIAVNGQNITVTTKHAMSEMHYIVRHTLVLENGETLGSKTFKAEKAKEAVSMYELPGGYKGKIYATSFCNLHDFWLNSAVV